MKAFFVLSIYGIVVCGLFQATSAERQGTSENKNKIYSSNPAEDSTAKTTTYKTTPSQSYRPEDFPATSDFPPSPNPPRICHSSTPCGWAVYTPFTRKVEYFTKNVCVCAEDKSCLRVDDDLAISAYVYKCGPKRATTEEYVQHW